MTQVHLYGAERNGLIKACSHCCRDLRKQDRVRLHVHFFVSLALVNIVSIIWYSLIHYELLSNPVGTDSVIHRNPVSYVQNLHDLNPSPRVSLYDTDYPTD